MNQKPSKSPVYTRTLSSFLVSSITFTIVNNLLTLYTIINHPYAQVLTSYSSTLLYMYLTWQGMVEMIGQRIGFIKEEDRQVRQSNQSNQIRYRNIITYVNLQSFHRADNYSYVGVGNSEIVYIVSSQLLSYISLIQKLLRITSCAIARSTYHILLITFTYIYKLQTTTNAYSLVYDLYYNFTTNVQHTALHYAAQSRGYCVLATYIIKAESVHWCD